MTKTQLKKANGDVFVTFDRAQDNSFIHAQWEGIQTLETVQKGATFHIEMMKEQSCPCLLNDHKELIGPWDIANDWIVANWTPVVRSLGLYFLAQVMAPGIYGQMSFNQLHQRIDDQFEIKLFEEVEEAKEWLLTYS